MRERTFGNDVADAHARIERRKRVLKHHLDARGVLAPGGHHRLAGEFAPAPMLASRMPAATRPSVDLPQPDSPTSPSVSPFAMAQRYVFDRMHDGRDAFAPVKRLASRSVRGGTDVNRRVIPARLDEAAFIRGACPPRCRYSAGGSSARSVPFSNVSAGGVSQALVA